jgi:hypothetical protein
MEHGGRFRPHQIRSDQLLFGQWFEAGFGQTRGDDGGRVDNDQSAAGSGGTYRGHHVRHCLMRRRPTPTRRHRQRGLCFGDLRKILFVDHVLGADLGCPEAAGTNPAANCLGVTFGSACRLGHCQHCSPILQQLTARRTATPVANGDIRRHAAALGEYEPRLLNGRRRSVNRKVHVRSGRACSRCSGDGRHPG